MKIVEDSEAHFNCFFSINPSAENYNGDANRLNLSMATLSGYSMKKCTFSSDMMQLTILYWLEKTVQGPFLIKRVVLKDSASLISNDSFIVGTRDLHILKILFFNSGLFNSGLLYKKTPKNSISQCCPIPISVCYWDSGKYLGNPNIQLHYILCGLFPWRISLGIFGAQGGCFWGCCSVI